MEWVDGIPIIGHLKALVYYFRDERNLSSIAFTSATHNTAVTCFGMFGGRLAGFPGGVAGSIIGGLFIDATLSQMTANWYGYFDYFTKLKNQNMETHELFDLLHLAVKDTVTGLLTYYTINEYMVWMQSTDDIENYNETDISSFMEENVNGFWKRFNLNTITVIPELSEIRGIPISSLKWFYRTGEFRPASSERIIHILCAKYFGVLGGRLAASSISIDARQYHLMQVIGSAFGGLIGGIFTDAAISAYYQTGFGYFDYFGRVRNTDNVRGIALLANDILSGVTFFKQIDVIRSVRRQYLHQENIFVLHRINLQEATGRDMSGTICALEIQKDMSGSIWMYECQINEDHGTEKEKCRLVECGKLEPREDDDVSSFRRFWRLLILNLPDAKRVSVRKLTELEPGDHLVYRGTVYNHHAIVGEVYPEKGKYTAYEQSSVSNAKENIFRGKALIKEIEKSFDADSLYKIDYIGTGITKADARNNAHFICHHATHSIFQIKPYNVLLNNCEHFTNFCAIGLCVSFQTQDFFIQILLLQLGLFGAMFYAGLELSDLKDICFLYQHVLDV